jgi:hypothetical protein
MFMEDKRVGNPGCRYGGSSPIEEGTMWTTPLRWRCPRARILVLSLAPLALLCGSAQAWAEPLPVVAAAPVIDKPASSTLSLIACRQMALEHQPAIHAAQSSLAAAEDRAAALEKLHSLLARDLPIRRDQSKLGVTIAQAGVHAAEGDAIYGVTYSYLAAVYAAGQLKVADEAEENLNAVLAKFQKARKGDVRKDVLAEHEHAITAYQELVRARRHEAEQGRERALAALREAMGVEENFVIETPRELPKVPATLNKDTITALAVARRAELIQAVTLARVVALEADAQATTCLPTARTFASGSDIHVRPVPAGSYGLEYSPAAVGPEMPAQLAGCKAARVQQAQDYAARADAVAQKTRNLIVLEAENAYRLWREKSAAAGRLQKAQAEAEKFSKTLLFERFDTDRERYPSLDTVLQSGLSSTRLRVEYQRAWFESLAALAMLERVTAGGVCIDFDAHKVTMPAPDAAAGPGD